MSTSGVKIILKELNDGESKLQQTPNEAAFQACVVRTASSKWKLFARQVQFNQNDIATIETNNNKNDTEYFLFTTKTQGSKGSESNSKNGKLGELRIC